MTTETAARADWLAERRLGIGGSDVGAILGLSKWKTPLDVFRDKRGDLIDAPDNDAMKWGRNLEPVIRQEYADATGREVLLPDGIIRHGQHGFMLANLDGFTHDGRVVEIKTARTGQDWGDPGTDQIPVNYLFQVQHYMVVTGYAVADVAVLIGGSDFRLYEVEADRELQEMMVDAEAAFWQRVQENDPPEPVSLADAIARWGRSSGPGMSVQASDDVLHAVDQLRIHKAQAKDVEAIIDEHMATILKALGECDTLTGPKGETLATWKLAKASERFDVKAFRDAHPDLAAEFTKTGEPSRRFLLKA